MNIRQEITDDYAVVYELVKSAFAEMEHADGTEQDLVERLRKSDAFIPELSLVAELDDKIVGHIMFTRIHFDDTQALCLAPVSVLPELWRQSIGSSLINRGHEIAKSMGFSLCTVVGHQDYYPRFGYEIASKNEISFPFEGIPDECAMVVFLDESGKGIKGKALFPKEFY